MKWRFLVRRILFVLGFVLGVLVVGAIGHFIRADVLTGASVAHASGGVFADASPFDAVAALLGILIVLVTGGQVALWLDDIPSWKEWHSPLKYFATLLITGLVGLLLVALQMSPALPALFAGLPPTAQVFLAWLCTYFASQLAHLLDRAAN